MHELTAKSIVLDYGLDFAIVSNYTVFMLAMIRQHGAFSFIL